VAGAAWKLALVRSYGNRPHVYFFLFTHAFFFISPYHSTHTTPAERRAEKQCRRRGASSGQKTKRDIEGEDPAAAGIERFFSLKGPRENNNVRASFMFFSWQVLLGNPPSIDLMGIGVGHVYYFLEDVFPHTPAGRGR